MNIRRVFAIATIPFLVGTFGFISLNQANAANQFDQIAQAQQPPQPSNEQPRPPRPDFAAAAAKLGVTEQKLIDALGVPPHPPGDRGESPQGNPPNQPK
nr:hypothetical protein [Nostoc sp. DedQUE03]MDZ7974103.1 hypothetical protein [Nostoc sp. DedQUE03]MDZ8048105.1 hypothetical protein [Nostoc sp. DedQUE02]